MNLEIVKIAREDIMQMSLVPLCVKSVLLGNIITKPGEMSVKLAQEVDITSSFDKHLVRYVVGGNMPTKLT